MSDQAERKIRVVVLDDDQPTREFLGDFVRSTVGTGTSEPEVVLCRGMEDFNEAVEKKPFDACIMDIRMPGGNGIERRQALIDEGANPDSVILVTAARESTTFTLEDKQFGEVRQAIVDKPIDPFDLSAKLGRVVPVREISQQIRR